MCLPQGQGATLPPQLAACSAADCPAAAVELGSAANLVNVIVEIANTGTAPLELIIPAGQTFVATTNLYQDGLAIERLQATIAPGTTGRFVLRLFCTQASRSPSSTSARYAPGPITGNAQLLDIIALANGKLGGNDDPATVKSSVIQLAVWEVTDGRGALTAQQRNLLTTLLATSGDDILTQITLFEQFKDTLSHPF